MATCSLRSTQCILGDQLRRSTRCTDACWEYVKIEAVPLSHMCAFMSYECASKCEAPQNSTCFYIGVGRFFNVFYPSDSCHDVKDLTRCFCGKDAFETSMRVRACQSLRSFHLTCDSGESRVTRIRAICKYMSHSKGSMYPMPCHVDSGHAKTVRLRPPCAVCWRLMLI